MLTDTVLRHALAAAYIARDAATTDEAREAFATTARELDAELGRVLDDDPRRSPTQGAPSPASIAVFLAFGDVAAATDDRRRVDVRVLREDQDRATRALLTFSPLYRWFERPLLIAGVACYLTYFPLALAERWNPSPWWLLAFACWLAQGYGVLRIVRHVRRRARRRAGGYMQIDADPHQAPSARAADGTPGEVELRVWGQPESRVHSVLLDADVEVLAIRERIV